MRGELPQFENNFEGPPGQENRETFFKASI